MARITKLQHARHASAINKQQQCGQGKDELPAMREFANEMGNMLSAA